MLKSYHLTILLLLSFFCSAAEYRTNLCNKNEKILLNCLSGIKIASICASNDATRSSGYAKYRFGTPQKIELEFPPQYAPPSASFSFNSIPRPGGSMATISFTNGNHTYLIKDESGHPPGEETGFESSTKILIYKGDSRVKEILCENYNSGFNSGLYEIFENEN